MLTKWTNSRKERTVVELVQLVNNVPRSLTTSPVRCTGGAKRGLMRLFMTHPPLDERIEKLKNFR
jgi:Zn-dependent protease with chaperone function